MIASIHRIALAALAGAFAGFLLATPRPALAGGAARAAEKSVETGGSGMLTLCRNWLLFRSCNSYHHIALPHRIALGQSVALVFGSNTKWISYPVARIARDGDSCTIFDEADGGSKEVNKIEVSPCLPAGSTSASLP